MEKNIATAHAASTPPVVRLEVCDSEGVWHTCELPAHEAEEFCDEIHAALDDLRLNQVPGDVTFHLSEADPGEREA
ncbi:MAG: hypothetical protein OXL97_12375 [Chloroflexota bacterium]|nr:hypothetical protein [Chloroflexota bacterium]MDE2883875.1 hypothetical protein [Chloroflexota bacterium]